MLRQVIVLVVTPIAMLYVMNQVRKPGRWVGRVFLAGMNQSHSGLTDWGLKHVTIQPNFAILDVGCGGGRTIRTMAAIATQGRVVGVDHSIGSVEMSRAQNASAVQDRRVEVRQASVSQLPFPDATFDLVTGIETHYYWPDLPKDLREVLRVLKPGGTAILMVECYKGGRDFLVQSIAMLPLRATHLSVDEHREWFTGAGFTDVLVDEERSRGWLCVRGTKPAG